VRGSTAPNQTTVSTAEVGSAPSSPPGITRPGGAPPPPPSSSSPASPLETFPEVALDVEGMSCAGCAAGIERTLGRHPAVKDVRVRFADRTARLRWDPEACPLDAILEPVRARGFQLRRPADAAAERAAADAAAARWSTVRLAVSAFFAMNAMLAALLVYLDQVPPGAPRRIALAVSGLMAAPVVFFGGWPFHRRAVRGVLAGAPGMDLLVSLGATAAFGLSLVQLLLGREEAWFDTSAMIVLFLLVGRHLEGHARRTGVDAVGKLVALAPETVRVVDEATGALRHALAAEVPSGARFRLRPGERSPLDGQVIDGASTLDRSSLTGESLPVPVSVGDLVEAGTANLTGVLTLRVVQPVGSRALDRVAAAVGRLLDSRAPLEQLADRVARHFVVGVLVVGAGTLGFAIATGSSVPDAVLRATAVIVIACPCALGLATPLALVVAAGAGARRGVLFRDGAALERAARVDLVAFDKTGTLTTGEPTVVAVEPAAEGTAETLLAWAAAVEAESLHPFARAIVRAHRSMEAPGSGPGDPAAEARSVAGAGTAVPSPPSAASSPPAARSRQEVPGAGVLADLPVGQLAPENDPVVVTDRWMRVRVGRRGWLESEGVVLPGEARDGAVSPSGRSRVHVAADDRWLGSIELADEVRQDARAALDALRRRGTALALWTGDEPGPAAAVARALGLEDSSVAAGLRPEDKAELVTARRRAGQRVAFVGDGTNDAPALAAADVGVAVHKATDIALETADVVVRAGGLARVVEAFAHARRTRRVMFRNFGWAVGYNLLALPAAVAGLVPPAVAALAMAASSVSVALSSLTLARTKTPVASASPDTPPPEATAPITEADASSLPGLDPNAAPVVARRHAASK